MLSIDPEIVHGRLCFRGARLPLTVRLDNLSDGMGVEELIEDDPTADRKQVLAVIDGQARGTRRIAGLGPEE